VVIVKNITAYRKARDIAVSANAWLMKQCNLIAESADRLEHSYRYECNKSGCWGKKKKTINDFKNDRTMKTIAKKVRKFPPLKTYRTSQSFFDLPNFSGLLKLELSQFLWVLFALLF
jgi:hypothetical protein